MNPYFPFVEAGARFSPCGKYRYTLTRTWDAGRRLVFLMLNPSTATDEISDPTVTRCIRRARDLGYAGVEVLNLFALRSPYPAALYKADDPIGPDNDHWICHIIEVAGGPVVLAWGQHGNYRNRARDVLQLAQVAGAEKLFLRLTKDGTPGHPLYIPAKTPLKPYKPRG